MARYDVVIVGYGPVSQLLALALGRQGRSVAVVERWRERYPLPRAVCVDHELYRVLAANGLADELPRVSHAGARYQWFNADWRELLVIDWSTPAISGGTMVNFVHQPTLEEALDARVAALPSVDLLFGREATAIGQDGDEAWVETRADDGAVERVAGRYVVGCDGANSIVRSAIGGGQEDRGFEADWLVIDVRLKDGVTIEQLGVPASGQYCNPAQPTTIVPAGVRDGRRYRRWEFMRLPGVSVEALEREERVWELLAPWAGPDQVELVRYKVYNFRSLLAERWRDRRLLIAGDAAHVMPPFLGQGMCSGMRDVWNLAWRLGRILDGRSGDVLLDDYQAERLPHISQLIDMSIFLGRIICTPDPAEAARRDAAFFAGEHPPFPDFPMLGTGLLRRVDGRVQAGAGQLSPHARVKRDGAVQRLDDATGPGFVLMLGAAGGDRVPAAVRDVLVDLEVVTVELGIDGPQGAVDLDRKLRPFLDAQGWVAMVVRPDFYVYGAATDPDDVMPLLDDLLNDLAARGARSVDGRASVRSPGRRGAG